MMKDSCYQLFFTPLNVWEPAYFIHCILNGRKSSLLKKYLTEKHMFTSISVKDICGWWVKIIMPSLCTYTTRNHDNSTYCHLFFYTVKCKLEFKLCFFCSVWSIKQASKQKQNNQTLIDI